MQRVAFQLRLKPGAEEAYDEAHRHVWPDLIGELRANGVQEYSIFRRNSDLFLYMLVADFQLLVNRLADSEVDRRWQRTMAPLLETASLLKDGESFAMMEEVFHMSGTTAPPGQAQ